MDPDLEAGNSWQIVSSVYLAVLLPWAFLYLHDFISERWANIRRTRIAGYVHLLAAFLPTPYIIVYVVLQVQLSEPDFKEMCAAVTAVVFSIYHVLRTLMGLHQLAKFRAWAIHTARVMEMASFRCDLSVGAGRDLMRYDERGPWYVRLRVWVGSVSRAGWRRVTRSTRGGRRGSIRNKGTYMSALSSHITLQQVWKGTGGRPEPIDVENGFVGETGGEAAEYQTDNPSSSSNDNKDRLKRIEWFVDHMMINSSIIDNEFINSNSPLKFDWSKRILTPRHRKSMFIRWSVVYLAQFGREFLKKCKTTTREESTWSNRKWNFATSVWATAALRMQSHCPEQADVIGEEEKGNTGGKSFMELTDWERLTAFHHDQVLSKRDALKKAFVRGKGLPHGAPLVDPWQEIPSRGVYQSLIKDAVNALPTRYYEEVENLNYSQLEWFALILSVGRWGGCRTAKDNLEAPSPLSQGGRSGGSGADVPLDSKDTAVKVLQQQLGLPFPPSAHDCGFPFPGDTYGGLLWGNRCVLQVSGRIDNWVCLYTGQALVYLLANESKFRRGGKLFRDAHDPLSVTSAGSSTAKAHSDLDSDRGHRIRTYHHDLEIARLRYQLAQEMPQHNHLEHSLTFMGCIMETVRSELAESLDLGTRVEAWNPGIPSDELSFPMSTQLKKCLMNVFIEEPLDAEGSTWRSPDELEEYSYNSAIEERLLWECQNGLYWKLDRRLAYARWHGHPASAVESLEAMMLCLLGFPSVRIVPPEKCRSMSRKPLPILKFGIEPVMAPQVVHLVVSADCGSTALRLKFLPGDGENPKNGSSLEWRWQDWRDAFQGRMLGQAEWQRNHYMTEVPIRRTKAPISSGIEKIAVYTFRKGSDEDLRNIDESHKAKIWEGWRPFRAGMTIFELKNSELIILSDTLPGDSYDHSGQFARRMDGTLQRTNRKSLSPYFRVHHGAITDASFHLDSLLSLSNDVLKEAHEQRTSQSSSTLADKSVEQDLSSDDMQIFRAELIEAGEHVPKTPEEMLELMMDRARRQDPVAMHRLAKMVWRGEKPYKKDLDRALQLMERALVLGRRMETAQLLVKALLDVGNQDVDIERALRNLELLWRDISGRRKVVRVEGGKGIHGWKGQAGEEMGRVWLLRDLHLKVIGIRPKAEMIRDLADRLSTWSSLEEDNDLAIRLYETAILAKQDTKAILELGRKFDSTESKSEGCNDVFAKMLYERVINDKNRRAEAHGAASAIREKARRQLQKLTRHLQEKNGTLNGDLIRPALERAVQARDVESMKDFSLMLLHGENGVEPNLVMGQSLARQAAYGDRVSRQLASGVEHLDIDRETAQQLTRNAARAFGRNSDSAKRQTR